MCGSQAPLFLRIDPNTLSYESNPLIVNERLEYDALSVVRCSSGAALDLVAINSLRASEIGIRTLFDGKLSDSSTGWRCKG